MNSTTRFIAAIFIFISLQSNAQFDRLLKKAQEKGKQLVENRTDKAREKLDSTDFIFAISVLDNSGIMNVQDWGENIAKGADNLINLNKDDDKVTLEQKLRNTIDAAELAYQQRKYKYLLVMFYGHLV